MKLAIVGCGLAVRWLHLPALEKLSNQYTVTSLLSRTRKSAETVAQLLPNDPVIFERLEDLLSQGDFDAVLLSLPTEHNISYIETFLSRGIPVICEKPIALDIAQGEEVLSLVENYGNLLYIAENYRHMPQIHKAKELISTGIIGDPKVIVWSQWGCVQPNEGYGATEWRANPKHVGGYLSDGGVHHMAGIRFLMGEVSHIRGYGFQQLPHTGSADTYSAALQFESGAIGSYYGTYGLTGGGDLCMVRGTQGYVTLENDKVTVYSGVAGDVSKVYPVESSMGYYEEFLDFFHFCEGKESTLGSPYEALADLRAIEDMVSSFPE